MTVQQRVRKVAIVGAGPAGLACVKALNMEPVSYDIDMYDSRSFIGGVWNYLDNKSEYNSDEDVAARNEYDFSPIYRNLNTNIPHLLMEYADVHFPDNTDQFPMKEVVLDYVRKYASTIGPVNVHLNSKVVDVVKANDKWRVTVENVKTQDQICNVYDGVMVCNGHFNVPRFPKVKGLDEWMQKDRKSITHARYYDSADRFKDQTVLVVGALSSGSDIAVQLQASAKHIYVSCSPGTLLEKFTSPLIELIPRIDEYNVEDRSIKLGDKIIKGIDSVIFCTGYLYDMPFLSSLGVGKDYYIGDLYKQMFYTKDPLLTFIGLGKNVSPLPLSECQASVIARYYSGRLKLPPQSEMQQLFEAELAEKGNGFHNLKFPKEYEYINELHDWIENAGLLQGLNSPLRKDERHYQERIQLMEAKAQRQIGITKVLLKLRKL